MRKALLMVAMLLAAAAASADIVTLPAAASIQGGSPFFSDVRVFNTSYTSNLDVTATYRCFLATFSCPATPPQIPIHLLPRESKAFDDMVASVSGFDAHDTAGGIEFEFSGSEDQLVVTSRLFSTSPQDSVGMFIPGLHASDAHPTTVLTSIRHDPGTASGFRTNVGLFNPGDSPITVTFTIFDAGTNQLGTPVTTTTGPVPGHSGAQINGIFDRAGAGGVSTENAVIVVSASGAVFSYAAVLDNHTADPIFVVGAPDLPQQAITPVATATPGAPTPTPPAPTPTPPSSSSATVNVGQGGAHIYVDQASGNNMTTIRAGGTVHWVWVNSFHSTTSDPSDTEVWDSGQNLTPHTFDHTFPSAGTFPYHCTVHGLVMNGTVHVNP